MCGIAGIVYADHDRAGNCDLLRAMTGAIQHRGPDGEGFRFGTGYAFGHRRLAIVDLNQGDQPMTDETGRLWVTYNGEIYNFPELRRQLEAAGYRFRTRCDTEVLLHGYREWGDDLPEHLAGMFVFAIWDEDTRRLFAARDRVGKKPFYYANNPAGDFLFGSELKALLQDDSIRRVLDRTALGQYLCLGYVPDPNSIYRGIGKLPPGSTLTLQNGQARIRRYWSFPSEPGRGHGRSLEDDQAKCLELLDDATRGRLMGDVPLGAFLSGGVDSQAVVDSMARSQQEVVACTIGFDDERFDERPAARLAAEACGAVLHESVVNVGDMLDLDWFADTFDEPFADQSAIPTYHVSRMARQHVTVALSGDGGDECFAGYRRYRFDVAENRWRSRLPQKLYSALGSIYPKADYLPRMFRAKRTLQNLAVPAEEAYARSVSRSLPEEVLPLLREGFREGDPLRPITEAYLSVSGPALYRCVAADFATWLPGDILTKVDRASMAVSLEVRAPFLDHRMIEFAMGLPQEQQFVNGESKGFLRSALRPRLGSRLDHPKQGFHVPMREWMAGPLGDELQNALRDELLATVIDTNAVQALLEQHRSGVRDRGELLWAVLVLQKFLARWGIEP